jgi:hypothetical protein
MTEIDTVDRKEDLIQIEFKKRWIKKEIGEILHFTGFATSAR